ncbi:uncharacterized protein [Prorops nasuta]|uniref:uncharacterized protein n=1 Tax=Prorops nasuta TaxID=863751 RepID=UPI0034CD820E
MGCKGRAKMINKSFKCTKVHSHQRDETFECKAKFRKELLEMANKEPVSSKEVYDMVSKKHFAASSLLPFHKVKDTLKKRKTNYAIKTIKTLKDLTIYGNDENFIQFLKFKFNNKEHNLKLLIFEEAIDISVAMFDESLLRKVLNSPAWSIDGTFECVPRIIKVYQLLTIMVKVHDKFLPVIWILMSNKRSTNYQNILKLLKYKFQDLFAPSLIITDFEIGLQNSVQLVFPSCDVQGCYFHYVSAIRKQAQKFKLFELLKLKTPETYGKSNILLRKMYNLALLPPNCIFLGFQLIIESLDIKDPEVNEIFKKLFKYYERYWLTTINPRTLSTFERADRTNNSQERYHRTLKEMLGAKPSFSNFISALKDLITTNYRTLNQFKCGIDVKYTKKRRAEKRFDAWVQEESEKMKNIDLLPQNTKIQIISNFLNNTYCIEKLRIKFKKYLRDKGINI